MTNDHPGLHLDNQLDAIANTWRPEVHALRAENEWLRGRLRAARRYLEDSQRQEWTEAEQALAIRACFRQLDMGLRRPDSDR